LLPVISKYVSQKRESNANTLHAFLYRLVRDLVNTQKTYELESNLIWNTVKEVLQGKDIPSKPQSYDTVEFGLISQKEIVQTLKEVFGAKPPDKRHGNSRALVFDKSKLERLSKIYDLDIEVQVVTGSSSPHMPHSPHLGLDRHIEDQSHDNEITKKQEQIYNNSKEIEKEKRNVLQQVYSFSTPQRFCD
jgi:hypothetical protein